MDRKNTINFYKTRRYEQYIWWKPGGWIFGQL